MARKSTNYTDDFKRQNDKSTADISKEYDIAKSTIRDEHNWSLNNWILIRELKIVKLG